MKDLSLISLERPGANKNLRNFSQQTQISKQSPPLLGHKSNKDRGRMSRWCYPKINHNIYGNQASNNTKINISHSFKDTEAKLSFKSSSTKPNKISLILPQCFNLIRVHLLAKGLFPTNPILEVPLSGRYNYFA